MKMGGKYLTIVILNVERKKKIMKNMQNIITRAYRAYEKKIRRKQIKKPAPQIPVSRFMKCWQKVILSE